MVNDFSRWTADLFQTWLLVLMRVAPIVFMMPLFYSRNIPARVKAGLTLIISLALLPTVKVEMGRFPSEPLSFGFFALSELMIGFLLGFSVRLIFAGLQIAGELAGFQMGFGMAKVMDPQSGSESTVVTGFYYMIGLLLFLTVDGHHWFFKALAQSFQLLAPGEFEPREGLAQLFIRLSGKMFVLAIKIVAPILAIMMLVQIAMGIIARMIPQVNVLMTSFPVTISLGLIFLGLSVELFWPVLKNLLDESGRGLATTLLPLMKGP
ncbi:MAG: flagellar biosynthetic protein FliR [Deltaproteobacteria bacterium]|nr:flagellar biosynthetic protein FliR [Deltaproteobacteria bacterium]